ncbi:methyl-accepting chemotaxis protein [Paraglaciecola sp. L3A3]|uniref:methyl-accepting chemotaxis protein n=1 Tax=Paraglaciecola sp. L3A3 TaxID=2686358 RepID=UPI00131D7458|nr:methyl-accepting chemotaxis protein [Paraglaciecola sp. L3A3]
MFHFKKISQKLTLVFLLMALTPLFIFAFLSINTASNSIKSIAFNQLESIRSVKKSQLNNYLDTLKASLLVNKDDPYLLEGFIQFDNAFSKDNIHGNTWKVAEQKYASRLKKINQINGWYDLFFINGNGDIIFTAAKESDLGMNIPNSNLSKSSIGLAFQLAQNSPVNTLVVSDFKSYPPSNNEPAAFIMLKLEGQMGYLALQFPLDKVNEIMQQRDGMGKTGETYLVGQDKLMRSDSFLDPQEHSVIASFAGSVKNNGVDTQAVAEAFKGKTGRDIIIDYNGNSVLSAFTTVDVGNFKWALIAEIDEAEAFETSDTLIQLSMITIGIVAVLIYFISLMLSKNISGPIEQVAQNVKRVADGDLTVKVEVDQHNELGLLQKSMLEMIAKLKAMIEHIGNSAEQQAAASQELSMITQITNENVIRQHKATDQVAAAITQMSASVAEVTSNTNEASNASNHSKILVDKGGVTVQQTIDGIIELASNLKVSQDLINQVQDGTANIVNILVVIKGIADQTNLLALNAAIEAARAGEQGRGFAVVADEVRTLAQNTQKSTVEIENMIQTLESKVAAATDSMNKGASQAETIVADTHEVTSMLDEVQNSVSMISDMNLQISAATQQQSTVAKDISQQASNISVISLETGESAKQINETSDELARLAVDLSEQVKIFKV